MKKYVLKNRNLWEYEGNDIVWYEPMVEQSKIIDTLIRRYKIGHIKDNVDGVPFTVVTHFPIEFHDELTDEEKQKMINKFCKDREEYLDTVRDFRYEFRVLQGESGYNKIYDKYISESAIIITLNSKDKKLASYDEEFFIPFLKNLLCGRNLYLRKITETSELCNNCTLCNLGDYVIEGTPGMRIVVPKDLYNQVLQIITEYNENLEIGFSKVKK